MKRSLEEFSRDWSVGTVMLFCLALLAGFIVLIFGFIYVLDSALVFG